MATRRYTPNSTCPHPHCLSTHCIEACAQSWTARLSALNNSPALWVGPGGATTALLPKHNHRSQAPILVVDGVGAALSTSGNKAACRKLSASNASRNYVCVFSKACMLRGRTQAYEIKIDHKMLGKFLMSLSFFLPRPVSCSRKIRIHHLDLSTVGDSSTRQRYHHPIVLCASTYINK
jgi:hypothetical protein